MTITGSASSVEGGAQVTLTNPRTNETVMVSANADGSFTAQLGAQAGDQLSIVVSDSAGNSSTPGNITVGSGQNRPPVANTGGSQTVQTGATVTLDGSGATDSDGDPLTYTWSFTSIPAGSTATLNDNTATTPYFVPDVEGAYVIELLVSDGLLQSAPATVTITATVGPPPAQLSKITTSVLSTSHIVIVGAAESVSGNTTVTVTNTRTGQAVTVNATGTGSFGVTLAAQPSDVVSIVVLDAANNSSPAVTTVVPALATLSVAITAPAASATIQGNNVLVRGTVQGPPNTGVTVNGIAATVQGNIFLANAVPLNAGSNTLTVTAATLFGQTATTSVTVTGSGTSFALAFTATPASGITGAFSPLPVILTYDFRSATPIQDISLDFTGDGTFEVSDAPPETVLSGGYSIPGVHTARLRVRDQQSQVFQAEVGIVVHDVVAMDVLFKGVWESMNTALLTGNKAAALNLLTPRAREKYERVFDALLPDMAAIVATFTSFRGVSVAEGYAEYALNATINGENRLFLIYFLKDADGVWRLEAM